MQNCCLICALSILTAMSLCIDLIGAGSMPFQNQMVEKQINQCRWISVHLPEPALHSPSWYSSCTRHPASLSLPMLIFYVEMTRLWNYFLVETRSISFAGLLLFLSLVQWSFRAAQSATHFPLRKQGKFGGEWEFASSSPGGQSLDNPSTQMAAI